MKKNAGSVALTVAGAVLCAVFSFLLVCNVTIIVKGTLHPETPPTVLGVADGGAVRLHERHGGGSH